jgi:hypothetical protein
MLKKQFWLDVLERAVKTAAQFGLFALGTTTFTKVGEVVNTGAAVGLALLFGAVLSVLTSLASYNIGTKGTASMLPQAPNA